MCVCIYLYYTLYHLYNRERVRKRFKAAGFSVNRVSFVCVCVCVCVYALQETPSGTPSDAERHPELTLN